MAKHSSGARPNAISTPSLRKGPAHAAPGRVLLGSTLTVDGVTRDAMGSSSLLGSAIPKGLLASGFGANHASDANTLTNNESFAQSDIATALAAIEAITKARSIRAAARNAEGIAPTSTALAVEGARLLAHGRGPRAVVQGMVAGDIARAVAMFERYGYTVNRAIVPPRLDPMTHYSYWQIEDATITGQLPQDAKDEIAEAFARGVTIWNTVSEIGTHPANSPRAGVSY
jgi:hypothetical protein